MKRPCILRSFFPSLVALLTLAQSFFAVAITGWSWSCFAAEGPLGPLQAATQDDLFQSTSIVRISIEIPEEGMQSLRHSMPRKGVETKPRAQARVSENGRLYTHVTVQLKGYTTFRSVDASPGLTLNFDKSSPKQKFHGLSKLSLNNSIQDPTRLHEKVSRELFAAAGVPVPRADYAFVLLNGRELGLYVLVEGFDKQFLKRHFERSDGTLYEAGVLQDIDRPLRVASGKDRTSSEAVQRLLRASREPDVEERWRALERSLDMDRFLSMVAVETILCHSDSYSMNRNNYRFYHDPGSDKIVFMPHGMDRVLGTHRSGLDLSILPPMLGLVARAVLSTPEGRRRHVARVGTLFTNLFQPNLLCVRVREIEARISSAKTRELSFRGHSPLMSGPGMAGREFPKLCDRIVERAASLAMQFAHLPEILAPIPSPGFDANGVGLIEYWKPKRNIDRQDISCDAEARDGRQVMRLRTSDGDLRTSMRAKFSLSAGLYRLTGSIKTTGTDGATHSISPFVLRYSSERFGLEQRQLNGRAINYSFKVLGSRAPEEIELVCDIRDDSAEVWFDASSLRITREDP